LQSIIFTKSFRINVLIKYLSYISTCLRGGIILLSILIMSDIPSIDSLHREKSIKDDSKAKIFNLVLNKCVEKISYTNRHTDKTFVIFEVPQVLIGYPLYDMKSCLLFLITKLSASGYIIEFIDPFYLYIDWGSKTNRTNKFHVPSSNPNKLKHDTMNLLQQFPNTSKIEFVYEDTLPRKKNKKKKR